MTHPLAEEDWEERIDRMLMEVWNDVPKDQSRKIRTNADSALWDKFVERDKERAGLNPPWNFGTGSAYWDGED